MMEVRFRGLAAGIALVALLGGCASDADPIAATETAPDEAAQPRAEGRGSGPSGADGDGSAEVGSQSTLDKALPRNANRQGGDTTKGLPPLDLPWEPKVPVSATVRPSCAQRGDLVRLIIETKSKAAVAFQAVYSDNRGGAEEPMGGGYGGNDKGKTGADGRVVRSWVIGPTAPFGTGRIDIIVGWQDKWGYLGEPFAVADSSGSCDAN
jgi:hypothetical protein